MDTTTFRTEIRHGVYREGAPMTHCGVRWPKLATVDPRDVSCYRCLRYIDLWPVEHQHGDAAGDDRPDRLV